MASSRRPSQRQMREAVKRWNEKAPIGARVAYQTDRGETIQTTTRSAAELLSGHTPVVWLNGVRGCVALTHVAHQN